VTSLTRFQLFVFQILHGLKTSITNPLVKIDALALVRENLPGKHK